MKSIYEGLFQLRSIDLTASFVISFSGPARALGCGWNRVHDRFVPQASRPSWRTTEVSKISEVYEMLIRLFHAFISGQPGNRGQSGATAAVYALLAGGVALAVIVGVGLMGGAVEGTLSEAGSGH